MKKTLLNILIAVAVIAACICGIIGYMSYRKNTDADAVYDDIQHIKPPVSAITNADGTYTDPLPLMDFTAIQAQNPDIVAWITVPGTVIDYPIVQAADNAYYLNRDMTKSNNKNGAIFLDYRNNSDFSDFNNILYGHHMKSGKMFQNLVKFKDKDFFDKHTTAILYTPQNSCLLEITAVAVVEQNSDLYAYTFASPADKRTHLDKIVKAARFVREVDITEHDRIITMSTCSYEFDEARTLLVARVKK